MTDTENQERIAQVRARLGAATPGPWAWAQTAEKGYGANVGAECFAEADEECEHPLSGDLSERIDDYTVLTPVAECFEQEAAPNAALIANAPTDLAFLLSRVDSLESALREAQKDVERLDWLGHRTNIDTVTVFPGDDLPFAAYLYAAEPIRRTHTLREAIDAARDAARADTGESTSVATLESEGISEEDLAESRQAMREIENDRNSGGSR